MGHGYFPFSHGRLNLHLVSHLPHFVTSIYLRGHLHGSLDSVSISLTLHRLWRMQRIEGMREDSFMFIVTGSNQANSVSTVTVQ